MMSFRIWLENKNIRDTILSLLGLDNDGVSVSLDSFDVDALIKKFEPLGFWQSLDADKKQKVTSLIRRKRGTIADLIDIISKAPDTDIDYSLSPPREEM
jgi:hypothetical protein